MEKQKIQERSLEKQAYKYGISLTKRYSLMSNKKCKIKTLAYNSSNGFTSYAKATYNSKSYSSNIIEPLEKSVEFSLRTTYKIECK